MKNVFVSNAKDDKSNAKKLVSKLEASGIKCFTLPRDKSAGNSRDLIANTNVFILILSKNTLFSTEVVDQLKVAYDNNCHIIPFKTGKLENDLTMQYFLHSLEWVDAHEDDFNEAFDILTEIIEEINGKRIPIKKKSSKSNSSNDEFELKKTHLYIVIAILSAIIIYLFAFNEKEPSSKTLNKNTTQNNVINTPPVFENSDLQEEEKMVVGAWKMFDYEDSRIMSAKEKLETDKNIESMKQNVLLKYNADRTFERVGFTPKPQKGYWEYDAKKRKIYLTPEGQNRKEEINIFNLSENEMTIVVTEYIQSPQGKQETVTTKISFQKQ